MHYKNYGDSALNTSIIQRSAFATISIKCTVTVILVGCGAAVANGSSCGSGALSGAATAGAGPLVNGQSYGVALVENAVVGGVASVAGGGKFANGAITGAFGYMFNSQAGRIAGGIVGGIIGTALTGPEDVPLTVLGFHVGSVIGDFLTGPDVTPGQLGREGEAAVRSVYDIGDKVQIEINDRVRIPDGLTDTTLSEVKNVGYLGFTQQLRDYSDFAQQTGRGFNL